MPRRIVPFASNKWDFDKAKNEIVFLAANKSEDRAMGKIASNTCANFAWLAETYGIDDAKRIMIEAIDAADIMHRNAYDARGIAA